MTKEQKAHVEATLIQRIDDLARDRSRESDEAIAALTRELIVLHDVKFDKPVIAPHIRAAEKYAVEKALEDAAKRVIASSSSVVPPTVPLSSYDGLTPEEAQSMLADVEAAKEKKSYTPVFVGASGVTYIGGVKLEAVKTIVGFSENGVHEVRIAFDTDKATNHYRPKKEGLFE